MLLPRLLGRLVRHGELTVIDHLGRTTRTARRSRGARDHPAA